MRSDARTSLGQPDNRGDVEVPKHRHGYRARDGSSGEHENVRGDVVPLQAQRLTLLNSEAVLLVHDDEPQVEELNVGAQQSMSANDDAGLSRNGAQQGLTFGGNGQLAGDERGHEGGREVGAEGLGNRTQVLGGQHLGGSQQNGLTTGVGNL